ncbi:MAG: response regulator [Deltaproteobacteria bacterium]|nr:response regulator [Deltaproteobacteria bacterium]
MGFFRPRTLRALIVDDELSTRLILRAMLSRMKLEVIDASNGQEALHLIRQEKQRVDLVITDINMPVMDGVRLIYELRSGKSTFEGRILALSTEDSGSPAARMARANGADYYLTKPVSKASLEREISLCLSCL